MNVSVTTVRIRENVTQQRMCWICLICYVTPSNLLDWGITTNQALA